MSFVSLDRRRVRRLALAPDFFQLKADAGTGAKRKRAPNIVSACGRRVKIRNSNCGAHAVA